MQEEPSLLDPSAMRDTARESISKISIQQDDKEKEEQEELSFPVEKATVRRKL